MLVALSPDLTIISGATGPWVFWQCYNPFHNIAPSKSGGCHLLIIPQSMTNFGISIMWRSVPESFWDHFKYNLAIIFFRETITMGIKGCNGRFFCLLTWQNFKKKCFHWRKSPVDLNWSGHSLNSYKKNWRNSGIYCSFYHNSYFWLKA